MMGLHTLLSCLCGCASFFGGRLGATKLVQLEHSELLGYLLFWLLTYSLMRASLQPVVAVGPVAEHSPCCNFLLELSLALGGVFVSLVVLLLCGPFIGHLRVMGGVLVENVCGAIFFMAVDLFMVLFWVVASVLAVA